MAFDIDSALRYLIESGGSDLHLKIPAPPTVRIDGDLQPIPDQPPLAPEDTETAFRVIAGDQQRVTAEFGEYGEADFSYSIPGLSRFRVNAFRQRGSISIVCRAIPFQVRTIEELGLPPVVRKLADEQRGIILLTGTTGSGKSSTLAAMIDHINETKSRHIVTLEDPIEYLHHDKKSIINQREVGDDTVSFARAMRRVLRQDPDVILIGEMRDEETVRTALAAAETGHLVMSTLHTMDATETVNRIIDFFPPHLQNQARVMLASTLRGVVGQRLVPHISGKGRVAICEVLVVTGRVEDLILNPAETGRITEVIAEGEYYGMQTFDQALLKKVMDGEVSEEVALEAASSPHDFKLMLQAGGRRASGIEQFTNQGDEEDGEGDVNETAEPAGEASPEQPAAPAPEPAGDTSRVPEPLPTDLYARIPDPAPPTHVPPNPSAAPPSPPVPEDPSGSASPTPKPGPPPGSSYFTS